MKPSYLVLAFSAILLTGCVTSNAPSTNDDRDVAASKTSRGKAAVVDRDGVVRDSDEVAIAVDPLTDKLMLEVGFNGAIVSGPDNNAHVVPLFETKEDLENFRKDMIQRQAEFKRVKGQWHFSYRVKGNASTPATSGLVRIKLDVEKFEEEADEAH